MDMDWYAWLSRSGLDPELSYEYSLLLARNELAGADVAHFDHDFLSSMGVTVAKHRLEILKLARKDHSKAVLPWRATSFLASAVHRSVRSLAGYVRSMAARRDRAAVMVVPRPPSSPLCYYMPGQLKSPSVMRRSRKLALLKHVSKPRITYGVGARRKGKTTTDKMAATVMTSCFASPTVSSYDEQEDLDGGEEMRWESMFQDLKPT